MYRILRPMVSRSSITGRIFKQDNENLGLNFLERSNQSETGYDVETEIYLESEDQEYIT